MLIANIDFTKFILPVIVLPFLLYLVITAIINEIARGKVRDYSEKLKKVRELNKEISFAQVDDYHWIQKEFKTKEEMGTTDFKKVLTDEIGSKLLKWQENIKGIEKNRELEKQYEEKYNEIKNSETVTAIKGAPKKVFLKFEKLYVEMYKLKPVLTLEVCIDKEFNGGAGQLGCVESRDFTYEEIKEIVDNFSHNTEPIKKSLRTKEK